MKVISRLASIAFLFACTVLASATPADFKANVLDPPAIGFNTAIITASPFEVSFSTCQPNELPNGLTADGCFAAVNRTGLDWTSIQFVFPNDSVLNSQPTDCSPAPSDNIFQSADCGFDSDVYTLVFSNGILHNNDFFFVTETGVPAELFPSGTATVLTTTASTPEPASFVLLATGLGMSLCAWKLQRS